MNETTRDVANVLVFVAAALAFAYNDSRELASACLGCSITLVTPRNTKIPPAAIGLVVGILAYSISGG